MYKIKKITPLSNTVVKEMGFSGFYSNSKLRWPAGDWQTLLQGKQSVAFPKKRQEEIR